MKTIYKSLIAAVAITPALTSCIEEVFPTNGVTEEQLGASSKATEAIVFGMTAYENAYNILGQSYAYDWGYGSQMHIRDVMTGGMAIVSSSYDWYTSWEQCKNNGPNMASTQYIWNFFTQCVLTANNTIGAINPETANSQQLYYLGTGYAFRAHYYLDMARMYEFLENDKVSPINVEGNNVLNLTVPIVTEETSEEMARYNPRATRQEMYEFILSDLQNAEKYIQSAARSTKTLPDLACVYGLFARLFMWVEDYPQAATYARQAINAHSGSPLTRAQWLDTTTGFNTLSTPSWMWGVQCMKEDDVVQSGILNWTSWMSNEADYGYAIAGPMTMISASYYNRMSNDDFRKLSYVAPEGSPLAGQEPAIDPDFVAKYLPTYASLKFRPGDGNMYDYQTGSSTAYPLMRVEEMYLTEAEAVAHSNPVQGAQLLNTFMQNYRYSSYNFSSGDMDSVVEEIFFQKSIELWGEGQSFFDLKRLGYSVTRDYEGTNFYESCAINTNGRPAWLNLCIVQTEGNNNLAVTDWNNPSPADVYGN